MTSPGERMRFWCVSKHHQPLIPRANSQAFSVRREAPVCEHCGGVVNMLWLDDDGVAGPMGGEWTVDGQGRWWFLHRIEGGEIAHPLKAKEEEP